MVGAAAERHGARTIARVANRFTRVPDRPPPVLDGLVGMLVPIANLFMLAMISRPQTGTLRTTWVTPATLALCAALLVIGIPLGGLLISSGTTARMSAGAALIVLALGAGAVAAVGIEQRRR
jgi:ABC-type Na+ efflux pump permease subunit